MLVAIVGATGTGKSELSLLIAERLAAAGQPAEIVNADAMQLYRGMDIGTAKLAGPERRGIPHHLFDVLDVIDEASVARYQSTARATILDIVARGAIPVLVGGSGLYISSVITDFQFPVRDAGLRATLEADLEREGPGMMYRRLHEVDPAAATAIGASNGRRLVRALEVVTLTGAPFGSGLPDENREWMPTVSIGLRSPRSELVARLDERVERMWAAGLVDEVRGLREVGLERGVTASRAIGYAQAIAQLRGEATESEAIAATQALTRKYARRQVSWFRRYERIRWLEAGDPGNTESAIAAIDARSERPLPPADTMER